MPRVKPTPYIEEIHGSLKGLVFKKSAKGEMILHKLNPNIQHSNIEYRASNI